MSFSLVPGFDPSCPARLDRASLLIESCCTTLDEALSAQSRGADRIELCVDLSVGGVTPPRDLIRDVVAALTIPVNVLVRPAAHGALRDCLPGRLASLDPSQAPLGPLPLTVPRVACSRETIPPAPDSCAAERTQVPDLGFTAVDFVYGEESLRQMISDIAYCKSVGVSGIVVGALTPEATIDTVAMRRLIAAARPLPVTFHRAFDVCTDDPFLALDQLIALGCTRLLTSGQAPTAWDGRGLIRLLVRRAGRRLVILVGKGVRPDNLAALAQTTGAVEFHGTALP